MTIQTAGRPGLGRKWHARWIWSDVTGQECNVYYYFRGLLDLAGEPGKCRLFVAADTRYQLFLNGGFVGRGAPQSQPFFQYYDEYEVGDRLRPGRNCVAVIVNYLGTLADTRGGFLLEIADAPGRPLLVTGPDWRVSRALAWAEDTHLVSSNKMTPWQEFFDARLEPAGWRDAGYDDRRWPFARVVAGRVSDRPPAGGIWSKLVPRDIPFMAEEPVLPVRVETVEENLDLDFRNRRDLAPGLSLVGRPIRHTRCEQVENLCRAEGRTAVQSSTGHRDLDFDGLYAPAVVLDFGRVITARARISLSGPAGGIVDIGYAERLIDGRFNIAAECEFADRYVMKDGEQVFESFAWKSFRYLKLRFRSCVEPVAVHAVHGVVSTYPYRDAGGFSSNDQTLNAVFDICRNTVRLCSNECLMDTPWREQAQWLGDVALVTVPAIQACFGDTALPRKFLLQAGQNQLPTGLLANISNTVGKNWLGAIPDYSLWWVRGLLDHFLYTGDEALLHRLYPQALRVFDAHLDYLNEDGLVEDMPYWVFLDWADIERRGICTAYNAIFFAALGALRRLAGFRGDACAAVLADKLRAGIAASFDANLYDAGRGCYADARIDGELSAKVSEHGNLTPVWAGLRDGEAARQLVSRVFESGDAPGFTEAQPFFMAIVLPALDRAGRLDLALDLVRRRWGRRMVDRGATSTFEEWYRNGSWRSGIFRGFLRSCSHAWSACPADFLVRGLLGLEILTPGCRKLRLAPREVDFDYHVRFPTPAGPVVADWAGGQLELVVPDGLEVVGGEEAGQG